MVRNWHDDMQCFIVVAKNQDLENIEQKGQEDKRTKGQIFCGLTSGNFNESKFKKGFWTP